MEELLQMEDAINTQDDEDVPENEVWYFSNSDDDIDAYNDACIELNDHETYGIPMHDTNTQIGQNSSNKKPFLTNHMRQQMAIQLFAEATGKTIPWVYRICAKAKNQRAEGKDVIVNHEKYKCGRKPLIANDEEEVLLSVPLKQRTTMKSFASALGVSPSTIYRLLKRGILWSHTNSIQSKLTPMHKTFRLKFVLTKILPRTVNSLPRFENLYNMVHIDEKWFFMSRVTQRFYLLPEEEDPYRATTGDILWDGKLGIFPFIDEVATQRSSKNRDKGIVETKPKQSITRETIRSMILDEVKPTIRAKWPRGACKTIWIQQDNARPHIEVDDPQFLEEAKKDGFDMHLICQPPQSPDLNILDLGFFRAIQSIQHQEFPVSVEELIESVIKSYNNYDPNIINMTWLHSMYVMEEILKVKGGNNYKSPHKGKKRLQRLGVLPTYVEVPNELVQDTVHFLNAGIIEGGQSSNAHMV
ncbi:uncharacterized protein [Spinacia oleracea]|uniref:Mariner transposase n=1 Tax=Spinacia oleracea TaxID=3562 RepID=A0ABM3RHH3_SPIOL|nr:uncharacterized protein LOC110790786 [Spinacia oleracea]